MFRTSDEYQHFTTDPPAARQDVTSASSECDNLQVALNDKRCAEMGLGDEKLQRLDRLLDRCNKKQVGSGAQCHDASARCLRVIHARDLAASVFIELVSLAPQGLGFCAGGRSSRRTTRSVEKRRRY